MTNNGITFNVEGTPDPGSTWAPAPDLAEAITSDRFSGAAATDINGRTLDAGFGDDGVARAWVANVANTFAIVNGGLVRGSASASGQATFPVAVADVELGFTLNALPAANGNALYVDVRLNLAAGAAGSRNAYRMYVINRGGVVYQELYRRKNASTLIGAGSTYVLAVGDRPAIRCWGNKIMMLRNDVLLETYQDVTVDYVAAGAHAGFESGTAAGFGLDDLYVEKYLGPAI